MINRFNFLAIFLTLFYTFVGPDTINTAAHTKFRINVPLLKKKYQSAEFKHPRGMK